MPVNGVRVTGDVRKSEGFSVWLTFPVNCHLSTRGGQLLGGAWLMSSMALPT
jgi:hypothetical protein